MSLRSVRENHPKGMIGLSLEFQPQVTIKKASAEGALESRFSEGTLDQQTLMPLQGMP
jgi:hypothetical protein